MAGKGKKAERDKMDWHAALQRVRANPNSPSGQLGSIVVLNTSKGMELNVESCVQ